MERDRESGRRTVGGIHQAMLKQVTTISDAKISAVSELHPTISSILTAFDKAGCGDAGKTLLQSLPLQSTAGGEKIVTGKRTLGARSAAELFVAYGLPQDDYDSGEDNTNSASKYRELVERSLRDQETRASIQAAEKSDSEGKEAPTAAAADVVVHESVAQIMGNATENPTEERALKRRKHTTWNSSKKTDLTGKHSSTAIALDSSDEDDDDDILFGDNPLSRAKTQLKVKKIISID